MSMRRHTHASSWRWIWSRKRASAAARIGFDDALIYREIPLAPEARRIPATRLLAEEAIAAFQAWEDNPNKIQY